MAIVPDLSGNFPASLLTGIDSPLSTLKGASPDWMNYRAEQWYGPRLTPTIATHAVVGGPGGAANSPMYATPIFIFAPVRIDQLGIGIGTSVASVSGKLALYEHDPVAVAPGALIEQCNGTVDMGSTVGTWVPLALAAPRMLRRGWYHIVSMFDGAAQPFTAQAGSTGYSTLAPLFGQANGVGLARAAASLQTTRINSANQDYDLAMPEQFGTPIFSTNVPGMPVCGFRVAP